MPKCSYHQKADAVMTCVGCKVPVCAVCRKEGAKGLCEKCVLKKGTGSLAPKPGAPLKAGQRADVVYCFRHDDIRAATTCVTCSRPYCPACLNTSGFCSVCARVNKDAQARAFGPNEKGRAVLAEMEAEQAAKRLKPRDYAVIGVLLVGLIVSYKVTTKPAPKTDATRETLAKLKGNDLSADQLALLARLKNEKKVKLKDPVPAAGAAGGTAAVGGGAVSGGGVAAPAGGAVTTAAAAGPLEIRAVAPGDGAIVGGTTSIRAAIAGGPSRVTCEVDGTLIGTDAGGAPRFSWNTRAAGNGAHNVTITAMNATGSTSTTFTLNVMNR